MAFDGNNAGSGNRLASSSTFAHGIGTGSFTVAGWWYPTTISTLGRVGWSNGAVGASLSLMLTNSATPAWGAYYTDGLYNFNTTLTANQWVHLAIRRIGTTITGWVNGAQEATTWSAYALSTGSIATATQYIGGVAAGDTAKANAAEVALWAAGLSGGEIAGLAKRRKPPDVRLAGLKAYWPLNREINERWSSNLAMAAQNGAATYVEHVPLIEELGQFVSLAASSPPAATPWLYARRSARIIGGGLS